MLILIRTLMILEVWKGAFMNCVSLHLTKGPSASLVVDERVQLRKARCKTRPDHDDHHNKPLGNGQIISIDALVIVMIIAVFHRKLI